MATSYTSLLGLALPVTGELSGTWGDTVNNAITSLLDTAVAGTTTLSTDGDVTLTTTTGASNQARQAILLCSGARTALRTITAPAQSKIYTVINSTTGGYSVKLVGAGPTTGVTIVAGESALVAWNGSDFIKISNTGGSASFTNVTVSGTTTLSGLTASTALALDASKNVVSVTNTGTGNNVLSASPTLTGTIGGASMTLSSLTNGRVTYAGASGLLQDSANLTFDGTTLTANALAITNGVTLSGGTANGVAYLNGSKVVTTGSALTFDGTTLSNTGSGDRAKFGTGTRSIYIAGDSGGVSLFDGAGQTGNGWYTTGLSSYVAGYIGSSEQMRLTSTGLGIGTSSPAAKLHISGASGASATSLLSFSDTGQFGSMQFKNGSTYVGGILAFGTASTGTYSYPDSSMRYDALGSHIWTDTSNTLMSLTSSGNLGLGVTPSAWGSGRKSLDVNNASFYSQTGNYNGVASNAYNNGSNWIYKTTAAAQLYEQGGGIHAWFTAPSGTAGNAISFTQAMTLDASGNLLVGATSNASSYRAQFTATGAGVVGVRSSAAYSGVEFADSGTSSVPAIYSNGNALTLWTSATERARIDSAGNLGLGVTPSAWLANGRMEIPSSGGFFAQGAVMDVGTNWYYGSGGFTYKTTAAAAWYQQNSGAHKWFTAPSGTAGNTISFTQAMTLDASGNLLVANTSASGTPTVGFCLLRDFSAGSASGIAIGHQSGTGGGAVYANFAYNGAAIGSITQNGTTGVLYNITSDQRLKENIQDADSASALIDSLRVRKYDWKADGSHQRYGFVAQELVTVAPEAVHQPEDPEQMMAVDYSKLVPMLVKEIQSLRARVAQLESN